nr:ATP synthase subunit 8 [Merocoris curtatus]
MPQMAPLWWELLFFLFIFSFMIMNTIIYYNKILTPKTSSEVSTSSTHQFKWKW